MNMEGDLTKNCLEKFSWQESRLHTTGLADCEPIGLEGGVSPHTLGIVVNAKYVSEIYVDSGRGIISSNNGIGPKHFNFLYGSGEYKICIIVRRVSDGKWENIEFDLTVNPKDRNDEIITNFFKSKTTGQYAPGSVGLDVAFSIATGITPKKILWKFGHGEDEKRIHDWKEGLSTHHTYDEVGVFNGKVTVTDQNDKESDREFSIKVSSL